MNLVELLQSKGISIERSAYPILLEDIEEEIPYSFLGKEDFIDFYLLSNGGYFNKAPYLCYNERGVKKTIEVSGFYNIPKIGHLQEERDIQKILMSLLIFIFLLLLMMGIMIFG